MRTLHWKRAVLSFLLGVLAAMAAGDEFSTAASWIWYPERPAVEGAGQTRYLRKVIRLAGNPEYARLRLLVDDSLVFTINGKPAPEPVEHVSCGAVYDLTEALSAGENVLGFAVHNAGGPGGLIAAGLVRDADGTEYQIFSDTTFRVSRENPPGWDRPGFDDANWPQAAIVGNAFAQPWYNHPAFDLEPFLQPGELERYRQWFAGLIALPPGIDREPDVTARIEYENGWPALFINGAPRPALIYRGTVDPLTQHGRRQIALFRDAGVHVYCGYWELAQCWPLPGEYRFDDLDNFIRGYLSVDPEAYLILILHLVPPLWWMDAHAEEMVHYAAANGFADVDECFNVRRPSLASVAWRRDMMDLWRRCIEHIESQPWGKRVIGYQPGYGIYTEWHYFGSWTNQMPDTGPAMTAYFRQWLRRRYGTVENLQKAWRQPDASFETAQVPGRPERLAADALGLRDPALRRPVMDYYLCQQELTADCIEDFCRAAKEITDGRAICGAFYGYWHGVPPQTQGGHLEIARLLKSPHVDYFAAPYDYSHRLMGQDGRLRCLPEIFPLAGKVHMVEADTRTHLHTVEEHGRLPDEASSIAAIRRELSTALIAGSALWWCDFGPEGRGGWYDQPALIGEVRKLVALAQRLMEKPKRRVAQVAVICDPESMYLLPDGTTMQTHYAMLDTVTTELYKTGAPFDSLLLSQLSQADLSRYRLLIFLDAMIVDGLTRAKVKAATQDKTTLWLWAPGICDGQRLDPELVRDLTGFRVVLRGQGVA
ncbi:MAG: beta-galactosidase, partial [Armatimonadetes bacterium]|nr:beta-galactosidase [Armatimonadota bacterium]